MKKFSRACAAILLAAVLGMCGCAASIDGSEEVKPEETSTDAHVAADADATDSDEEATVIDETAVAAEADALRIGSLKGPTSIGLASMMQKEQGDFTVVAAADELTPLLLQDELDIALVPANVAALLYQKTEGAIRVIDVNTLGVLYGVSLDESVSSIEDLRGRTVYMTGKGTVPEYTFVALLGAADMSTDEVTVEFCSEPAEVAAQVSQNATAVGILPQPYATAISVQNPDVHTVLDLNEAWVELTDGELGDIVTGVTIAKASTIEAHPDAIALFLERHGESAAAANADPAAIAPIVAELGIIDNEALAQKAIPQCNVVCLVGEPMREALSGYLENLYAQNPESIGALPDEDFYFIAQ